MGGSRDADGRKARFGGGLEMGWKRKLGGDDRRTGVVGKGAPDTAQVLRDPAEAEPDGCHQREQEDHFSRHKYLGSGHNSPAAEPNSNRERAGCQSHLSVITTRDRGVASGEVIGIPFAIYNDRLFLEEP